MQICMMYAILSPAYAHCPRFHRMRLMISQHRAVDENSETFGLLVLQHRFDNERSQTPSLTHLAARRLWKIFSLFLMAGDSPAI